MGYHTLSMVSGRNERGKSSRLRVSWWPQAERLGVGQGAHLMASQCCVREVSVYMAWFPWALLRSKQPVLITHPHQPLRT